MARVGALVDLLLFYTLERSLFNRMVRIIGKTSLEVKRTIALWLVLEEIGYHDLIRTIYSYDNKTIEALSNEALQCLECMKPDALEPTVLHDNPVFQGLLDEPMNFRFFYYNREFIYKRYMHIMETVCNKIFGDTAAIEVDESGLRPVVRPFIESSSAAAINVTPRESNLNAEASEFHPTQSPEDAKTMFLTFSKGHPLTREEIVNFFTSKWGEVVEDVIIEQSRLGQDPQFGRILFTTSTVIPRVLNGESKAKFLVNRKHLWARIYVHRHGGRAGGLLNRAKQV
ncbi:uncharacterized protein LOC116132304 isoform X1 [Pistacia vera]|uniref:uncharacterized protein LOC116132304 isoform X1 n=1 Tax=Pistacia vera TaxID=55513 RepID=UPI00126324DD|nr:uncharacterized protein LOC116132304 isoform X1 [Pistacia vera]